MKTRDRILVALDTTDVNQALSLSEKLAGLVGGVKLGKEFYTANGPGGVKKITKLGIPVFLDLKFHDIPNTVAGAINAALRVNPFIINVHVSGGRAMLDKAVKALEKKGNQKPMLIGVTLLTSMDKTDLYEIGINGSISKHVSKLALLAQSAGLDGVVCSANEIGAIRKKCGENFKLIVPGIRPNWANQNDQKRCVIPSEAIERGADFLVIGRPITQASSPVDAVKKIVEEIDAG